MIPDERSDAAGSNRFRLGGPHPRARHAPCPVAAGFSFDAFPAEGVLAPLPLGVIAGLVLGTPIGVLGAAPLASGQRPGGSTWLEFLSVAMLCGVGFTMSLFIGGLALQGDEIATSEVQPAVIGSSVLSVVFGMLTLRLAVIQRARQ